VVDYGIPMTMTESESIPAQFSHSVKIEQTAKGASVTVHVNANSELEAMERSINLYKATRLQLEKLKEIVAPVEIKA
jgi:ribosome-associated translation inhibitor RaiA